MTSARVPPHAPPDRLLTVTEVALLLGKTPGAIYAMTIRRQLPFCKLGKMLRFRVSAMQAYIAALEGCSVTEALDRIERA